MAETFRTKVERTGKTATFLSVPNETVARANREPARVSPDDVVAVTIDHDVEPRVVDVPEDLAAALADDEPTRQAFEALSYSHQREYVEWVTEAKRPETRTRRIAGTLQRVQDGRTAR